MAKKWNSDTRGLNYDKERVVQRLYYWAEEYRFAGGDSNDKYALMLEDLAEKIDQEIETPQAGALMVITAAENFNDSPDYP